MARKPKPTTRKAVRCYRCAHAFEVDSETISTSCAGCHRNIIVEDLVLKKNRPKLVMVTELQTCGRLIVPRGARVVAELVEANDGMEVLGHLEARQVRSGSSVKIGKKAYWRGALEAPSVVVEATAVIDRAEFSVTAPA